MFKGVLGLIAVTFLFSLSDAADAQSGYRSSALNADGGYFSTRAIGPSAYRSSAKSADGGYYTNLGHLSALKDALRRKRRLEHLYNHVRNTASTRRPSATRWYLRRIQQLYDQASLDAIIEHKKIYGY